MRKTNTLVANLLLFFATAIWGATFIVIKKSLSDIHAVTLISYRSLLAALLLLVILFFQRKNPFANIKAGLVLGFLLLAVYLLQTLALYIVSATNSGFIFGLFVVFVPLFGVVFSKLRLQVSALVAVLLAVIGLWVITGGIASFKLGELATLGGSAAFAWYILAVDKYINKGFDPWVLNFQQFFVGGVVCLLGALIFHLPLGVRSAYAVDAVIYLGLFANVIAYAIQLSSQRYLSPIAIAVILSLEPVLAAIFSCTFGHEPISSHEIVGGIVIMSAIVLAQVAEFKKEPEVIKSIEIN
jgi:drug/metabolite transporter (DMT)-like permease